MLPAAESSRSNGTTPQRVLNNPPAPTAFGIHAARGLRTAHVDRAFSDHKSRLDGSVALMPAIDLAEAALADRDWARVRALLRDLPERASLIARWKCWVRRRGGLTTSIVRSRLASSFSACGGARGDRARRGDGGHPACLGQHDRRRDAAIASGWADASAFAAEGLPPSADDVWLLMREATLTGGGSEVFAEARRLAVSVGAFDAEMTAVALGGKRAGRRGASGGRAGDDGRRRGGRVCGELEDQLAITFACCQVLGACSRVRTSSGRASGVTGSRFCVPGRTSGRCLR